MRAGIRLAGQEREEEHSRRERRSPSVFSAALCPWKGKRDGRLQAPAAAAPLR